MLVNLAYKGLTMHKGHAIHAFLRWNVWPIPKKDDINHLFCKVEFANLINKCYLCMVLIA
ncbi:hypothetical protein HMPREF2955_06515 [Prevotella sp. HMSC073D09]|nr:hypothetical protein HMPREF2955_06515 [Prevotella sp. HMSC073D09]